MSIRDFTAQRLFIDVELRTGTTIECDKDQTNYLKNVLRAKIGDHVLVFNGREGEWRANIATFSRRSMQLLIKDQLRGQCSGPDIDYLFAPLKRARLDYMVQKATEMGARRLRPVVTQHTNSGRIKLERMAANAIEAAEQCGILHIPQVLQPQKLTDTIEGWDEGRALVFCDEAAPVSSPLKALQEVPNSSVAVLVGPEGGFSAQEREMLLAKSFVFPISIGPRILRGDTAAVAALALVNAVLGDWQ